MPDVNAIAVAVWTAMLPLPAPYYAPGKAPETCAERAERLTVPAYAIAYETEDADVWAEGWTRWDWVSAGIAKTYAESRRFALEVHDGRARGDRGQSVCLGQIMGGGDELVGVDLEATRRCYREVFRHLQLHQRRCRVLVPTREGLARVFSGYGTGHSCSATRRWAVRRAAMWARLTPAPSAD